MNTREILGVFGDDLEKIIRRARHEVTFQNVRDARNLFLEGIENVLGLTLKGDFNENDGLPLHLFRIEQGDIISDDPGFFQPLDTPVAR